MTLDSESRERAHRAPNPDDLLRRRAKKLAVPFHERIEPWQRHLARLRVTRMFRIGEDVQAKAGELLPLIIAARIELEAAAVEAEDEALAAHSLIASVRASLDRLRSELEEMSEAGH